MDAWWGQYRGRRALNEKSFDLPSSKVDIRRSFTEAAWVHVQHGLDAMEEGPESLRLQCILELLVTTGIRLDELANARHRHMRLEHLPDLPAIWVLTVTGKRAKTREVRLNPENLPLIRTLHDSVSHWGRAQGGEL